MSSLSLSLNRRGAGSSGARVAIIITGRERGARRWQSDGPAAGPPRPHETGPSHRP